MITKLLSGIALALISCSPAVEKSATPVQVFHTPDYELIVPEGPKALLVLFPGFGGDTADTRTESKIVSEATANGVAVLLMEFNRHLFVSDAETSAVIEVMAHAMIDHEVKTDRVFIGGFSSGGNVAVLLAKHLVKSPQAPIALKGVFVVDSPLDLSQLYPIWKKHAERSMTEPARAEGAMVIAILDSTLGSPADSAANYEALSPVTTSAASMAPLHDLAVRLYTEPDTAWWRIHRGDRYEDMNACYLEKLAAQLKAAGNTRVEFITSKDRGIQHGRRHPHAWSIVEEKDLVRWVLGV